MTNTKLFSKQIFLITATLLLFYVFGVLRQMTLGKNIPLSIWASLLLLMITCLVTGLELLKNRNLLEEVLRKRYEIIVFLAVMVLRIPLIQDMQRWDGGLYYGCIYDCVHDFSFSLEYLWNSMRFAGHPTIMFCFFSMLGEFITHGSPVGVGIVYTIMSSVAMVCLYRLFLKQNSESTEISAFMAVMLIQCIPLFWGTVSYVNPDYMYLLLFIYFWYAHLDGEYIMCFFWMFSLFQTKELGIIIVAGYILGYIIYILLIRQLELKKRLEVLLRDPLIIIAFINVLIMFIYYMLQGTLGSWEITTGESFKWFVSMEEVQLRGTDVNAFGIYPKYIVCKILQLFVINFNWIAVLGIVISAIKLRKEKRRIIEAHNFPMLFSMVFFAFFGIVFITFAILRYNVFFHVMLWYICLNFVHRAFNRKFTEKNVLCFLVSVLLSIQTFYYIDPLTNLMFLRIDSGKGKIVASEMRKRYFGDTLVNNFRYTYIDDLLNKLLTDVNYNENQKIVCFDSMIDTSKIRYLDDGKEIGWNTKTQKRELLLDDNKPDVCHINTVDYDELTNLDIFIDNSESELIIYFMKYIDVDEDAVINELRQKYNISDAHKVENWGGTLNYYVLRK